MDVMDSLPAPTPRAWKRQKIKQNISVVNRPYIVSWNVKLWTYKKNKKAAWLRVKMLSRQSTKSNSMTV